jgi:hypothetical protein
LSKARPIITWREYPAKDVMIFPDFLAPAADDREFAMIKHG